MDAKTGLACACGIAALALAGCGTSGSGAVTSGGGSSPAPPTTQATVTDTVVPPATTATTAPTTASGPIACATGDLTVSLGTSEGAAGSIDYPLHFTNRGATACTITAYPGVSVVAPGTGVQVGPAATRTGGSAPTITLSPGAEATSSVQLTDYANFPASACEATAVSGFRVYPPDNTVAAYVPFPAATKACTTAADLEVQPVVAGAGS
jgi:hypothetical protein